MIAPKFKLGDTVFMARYERAEKTIICPDCLGSARVKVTLGTGEEIMIECGGCDPGGYQGSTGRIKQYDYTSWIASHTVTGINLKRDDVEYQLDRFGDCCSYATGTERGNYPVFATEEEAKARGEKIRKKHGAEENKLLFAKTKNHKTWVWNASYTARELKERSVSLNITVQKLKFANLILRRTKMIWLIKLLIKLFAPNHHLHLNPVKKEASDDGISDR